MVLMFKLIRVMIMAMTMILMIRMIWFRVVVRMIAKAMPMLETMAMAMTIPMKVYVSEQSGSETTPYRPRQAGLGPLTIGARVVRGGGARGLGK